MNLWTKGRHEHLTSRLLEGKCFDKIRKFQSLLGSPRINVKSRSGSFTFFWMMFLDMAFDITCWCYQITKLALNSLKEERIWKILKLKCCCYSLKCCFRCSFKSEYILKDSLHPGKKHTQMLSFLLWWMIFLSTTFDNPPVPVCSFLTEWCFLIWFSRLFPSIFLWQMMHLTSKINKNEIQKPTKSIITHKNFDQAINCGSWLRFHQLQYYCVWSECERTKF